jgi:hypothetical protein
MNSWTTTARWNNQKCLESRDHNETLDIVGKTILKQVWERWYTCWLDSSGSGWGPVVGSCKHGNELFGFHWIREISSVVEQLLCLLNFKLENKGDFVWLWNLYLTKYAKIVAYFCIFCVFFCIFCFLLCFVHVLVLYLCSCTYNLLWMFMYMYCENSCDLLCCFLVECMIFVNTSTGNKTNCS